MRQTFMRRILAGSSSLALAASLAATALIAGAPSASAQEAEKPTTVRTTPNVVGEDINKVTVTARLREESIQEVPEQVVAITPDVLKAGNITSFYDLQGFAPSVSMAPGWNKNYSGIVVRGYGAAQYVNESPASPSTLYDLSGVQILYGPQGTLFGYVALGGAVLYTPAHPDLKYLGAGLDVSVGNLNTTQISAHANIPIIQDELGLRIAYSRNHTDGYTEVENEPTLLDGVDNRGLRIGLEWQPGGGKFKNYTVVQMDEIRDTAPPEIVTAYSPIYFAYQESGTLPSGYNKPGPLAATAFDSVCTPELLAAVWPAGTTKAQCVQQRFNVLKTFRDVTLYSIDLAKKSGYRKVPQPMVDGPLDVPSDDYQLQNTADYDLASWDGFLGGGTVRLHNITQGRWARNYVANFTAGAFDYYSFRLSGGSATGVNIPTNNVIITDNFNPPRNSFGKPSLGKLNFDWGNEFQVHGELAKGKGFGDSPAVNWILGLYGHWTESDPSPTSPNVPANALGAFTPNEGPVPSFWTKSSKIQNFGEYLNVTVDAGLFTPTLKGLQFTGGIRYNQNRFKNEFYTVGRDYTRPGIFFPTTPYTRTLSTSKPVNWSWSLNYITNNNTVYATSSYIVVPGFANTPLPAGVTSADVPGFVPFADDEQLTSYEIGNKWNFDFNNIRGYFNVAAYHQEKENTRVATTFFIPALARYVGFSANLATEVKDGIELQGQIDPTENLSIYANLSYADHHYSKYLTTDPFNLDRQYSIAPGAVNSKYCDPTASAASVAPGQTIGTCLLNLKDSPLRYNSEWQASLRINYTVPLGADLGDLIFGGTANYLSDAYIGGGYTNVPLQREIQIFGPQIEDAVSQKAYTLVNLRLTWDKLMGHDNYSISAYVTNATDETYAFGSIDFLSATGVATKSFGPPRKYGIQFSAKW